jgi:AraC-like DNA-binding protein
MAHLSRSAGLTGYDTLARALGLDPLKLARKAGVPAGALLDPDLKVSTLGMGRMLEEAAAKSGAEDFGIQLAEERRLSNMGAVGLIAREQPNLRKALDVMVQYQWLHNDSISAHIEEMGDIAVARLDFSPRARAGRQAIELSVGVLFRNIKSLLGRHWRPQSVHFLHAAPKRIDAHKRLFGVTPLFGQDFNGIVLTRRDLAASIAAADPDMARQVERYVRELAKKRARSTKDEAEELIVLLLPTGHCSASRVAKHLGIDRRTLHRHLAEEGETFSSLLDESRAELARAMMADPARTLATIAEHLGFSAASAFSHWFRRRFGTSAREQRRLARK